MNHRLACLLLCTLAAGCSKNGHVTKVDGASVAATATGAEVEPTEQELRDFEFRRYEAIEAQGGLQLTVSGQSMVVHPKVFDVHKERCAPAPSIAPTAFTCDLTLKMSLSGRDEPRDKDERVSVKKAATGEWIAWQD
jgi:hypothetical protein